MAQQFSSLAQLVQHYETGGSTDPYTAVNPKSGASGAYQFVNSTWGQYAGQIGVSTAQYPTAADAPPAVQDAVFAQAVKSRGLQDWTCPGCNPGLTSYVASNDVSALPVGASTTGPYTLAMGPDTSGQGYGSNGSQGDFYIDPSGSTASPNVGAGSSAGGNPNTPSAGSIAGDADVGWAPGIYGGLQETGLSPGTAATVSGVGTTIGGAITGAGTAAANAITGVGTTFKNFFTGWISSLENWVGRGFLILIGLVILAIALWRIVDPDGSKTAAITRNVEVAA